MTGWPPLQATDLGAGQRPSQRAGFRDQVRETEKKAGSSDEPMIPAPERGPSGIDVTYSIQKCLTASRRA
jgi:hypothetical protein